MMMMILETYVLFLTMANKRSQVFGVLLLPMLVVLQLGDSADGVEKQCQWQQKKKHSSSLFDDDLIVFLILLSPPPLTVMMKTWPTLESGAVSLSVAVTSLVRASTTIQKMR
jgi:hypothetical protein